MNKKDNQPNLKPILIYVAEDNESFASIMVNKLRGLHIGLIRSFKTGEEMLVQLKLELPTLVIVDYTLNSGNPDALSGKEVMKFMKKDYSFIPVIIITSADTLNNAEEMMVAGATDYIIKNSDWFDNLQSTIFNLIEIRDLKTDLEIIGSQLKTRIIWSLIAGLGLCGCIIAYMFLS